ncbi:MAG: hypothetical protein U0930_15755 [Pirellulales bacterium]
MRVKKILAANPDRDVALLKLDGNNFPYASVAKTTSPMGGEIVMIHHSRSLLHLRSGLCEAISENCQG